VRRAVRAATHGGGTDAREIERGDDDDDGVMIVDDAMDGRVGVAPATTTKRRTNGLSSDEEEEEDALEDEALRPRLRESLDASGAKKANVGGVSSGVVMASVVAAVAPRAPKPDTTGSSTSVDLIATTNLGGKTKVLFEIEGSGEAVDLDGDTGAVGRWLAEGARALKVDMKGVMYNARVAPCAGTVVIVAVNADQAKIESVHREYVQLREDRNAMGGMENFGVGSIFDDYDDDGGIAMDEDVGTGGPSDSKSTLPAASGANKRKRGVAASGKAKPKPKSKSKSKPRAKPKKKPSSRK
jgi:hypothetical protein